MASRQAAMQQMAADLGVTPFTPAQGITQMVDALGGAHGGTKAAAAQLGVAQRTVQRYLAYERGDRGPHTARNPAKSPANAQGKKPLDVAKGVYTAHALPEAQAKIRADNGRSIAFQVRGQMFVSQVGEYRTPPDVLVDVDELDTWLAHALGGDWNAAAKDFDDIYFEAYASDGALDGATWEDYDALDMEPGY